MNPQYEVNVDTLTFQMRDKLDTYLRKLVEKNGSDLHIKANSHIRGRFGGDIEKMSESPFSREECLQLAKELLITRFPELVEDKNVDFTYKLNKDYRFRVNIFFQIEGISAVFRTIPMEIPTVSSLNLPEVIRNLARDNYRGLILVTGPTGSGKTTTLASMLNYINQTRKSHIITIEDPVEYVYQDDQCIINQRGIGQDATSFASSLRAALREDPDVILVGEMRDLETIETALHAAETGHLVLSTLHTLDAKETISRVISMFPGNEQNRIKLSFASVLKGIISQRLVKTIDGKRRAAVEVLVKTHRVREMIQEDRDSEIIDAIKEGRKTYKSQTFDQHLFDLYTQKIIDADEALENSTTPNDLKILIDNHQSGQRHNQLMEEGRKKEAQTAGIISLKKLD